MINELKAKAETAEKICLATGGNRENYRAYLCLKRHKYFLKMLAKTALLRYNNYSDKKRVIICVLKGILDVCFSVKSTHFECL